MITPAHPVQPTPERNGAQAYAFLQAVRGLGPGPHRFREIIHQTGLSKSEAHRRLSQLVDADLCRRPRHGQYELLTHAPAAPSGPASPVLRHPGAALPRSPLLETLLNELHARTGYPVLLHTYAPLSGERLCAAATGTHTPPVRRALASAPEATGILRQAPLGADAAGLAMLAHLCPDDAQLREDLRRVRRDGMARTRSPLPGWSLVAVPLRRLPGTCAAPGAEPPVVGALSVLHPDGAAEDDRATGYGLLLRAAVESATAPEARTRIRTAPRCARRDGQRGAHRMT
ncbi:helix-turn-helix domain-containing protein [Streptomyces sp. ISL-94]|uniref:helix-turn-helix domain-containing protein n=1 Tax=Streptomyces sp. ISL-94 TaxID=2819190 RepID=UPI0027E43E6E|nr:helix-turn-helix domain-containing protein [Streptomyces sp. ISL-94]